MSFFWNRKERHFAKVQQFLLRSELQPLGRFAIEPARPGATDWCDLNFLAPYNYRKNREKNYSMVNTGTRNLHVFLHPAANVKQIEHHIILRLALVASKSYVNLAMRQASNSSSKFLSTARLLLRRTLRTLIGRPIVNFDLE